MRDGFKIYDADTHCGPAAEQLNEYLSPRLRELVPDLEAHQREIRIGLAGEVFEPPYRHRYSFESSAGGWGESKPRILGEAAPRDQARRFQHFMGSRHPTYGGNEWADVRLKDMDEEGVDVHMMVGNGANNAANPEVEMEFIQANHRCLDDMCAADPHRLKSMIVVTARSIAASVAEIERWGDAPWAVAIQPYLPLDYPIDHPDLAPLWAAAQAAGLAVVHHSFASGYPGYRDLWENPFIGRSASHPWAAMRFLAAVTGSGMMDRFPRLNFAILESGFGWLPFWARRLDDQMVYVGYVDEGLKYKPSEYLTSGRFFASIEMHEGPEMATHVTDLLGEDILMLGTDYPHAESRFPESTDLVLDWQNHGVAKPVMRKLIWDNAVRCFGEP
jgi:predicted TIM-barrel fold metal-dependent hydrolase